MKKLAPYWKAVVGFIAPGAAIITATALTGMIDSTDWIVAAATCVVTGGAVYAAPKNKPTT